MQVLKFGGTSVGAPERMAQVADIILDGHSKIIVLSAVSGTTNKLVELADLTKKGDRSTARNKLSALREEYRRFVYELLKEGAPQARGEQITTGALDTIADLIEKDDFSSPSEKIILAQGELISTQLFQLFLKGRGENAVLLPALDFMRTDAHGEPDLTFLETRLRPLLEAHPDTKYFITQGYICRNAAGKIDNLKRGGSDYTATLIGAALQASEIQIWTDIDGLHNNDPRVVDSTFPVRQLSYREAAELAYFGAKILHPTCVLPAEGRRTPIRLKNTFKPKAPGTLISGRPSGAAITAIAAKDGITAIKIRSSRMLNAYGFLRRVFQVFEEYRTPIDMITTSEVAVSLTIDDDTHLPEILRDLAVFGEVHTDNRQAIICIVGDQLHQKHGYAHKIFTALKNIPIRMVSYGGSNNNVSILVGGDHKNAALQALNQHLFTETTSRLTD